MKRVWLVGGVFGLGVVLTAGLVGHSVFAETASVSAPAEPQMPSDTKPQRERIKQLLQQGAYRDALQELEILLTRAPHDPWALAYRSLTERRLRMGDTLEHLSSERAAALERALQEERREQTKAAVQAKKIERQLAREQAKWDVDIQRIQRDLIREEKAKRRQKAHAAKAQRRQAKERRVVARATPLAPVAPPPSKPKPERPPKITPPAPVSPPQQSPTPALSLPSEERQAPPSREPSPPPTPSVGESRVPVVSEQAPSVELAPIMVATGTAKKEPSPTKIQVPEGAMQIFADQMSVVQERQIATAEGNVQVVFSDGVMTSDKVTVFTDTNDIYAQGHVRLERGDEIFRGELVHYNTKTKKGRFLEGTAATPPWYQYGRMAYHLAEGVMRVTPGYLTSCEFEPPHFRLQGRKSTVFSGDRVAKASGTALIVENLPMMYFPWITVADRQTPFFLVPGKRKPWGAFALGGYRYELAGPGSQKGALRMDWRQFFMWGFGVDHHIESQKFGRALLKLYYNEEPYREIAKEELLKGADHDRYRVLWRHKWQPLPDTTVITDIQKFSDVEYRKELLFREEFVNEGQPDSFISSITSTDAYALSFLTKKRINRFQTVDEALPQMTLDLKPKRIEDTQWFSETKFDVANLQHKTARSDQDYDVSRVDWFQQLSYAMNWFRPVLLTPKFGVRQTYYSKDKQGSDRQGQRHILSGQVSAGGDASLKLFRIFPVATNWLGLNVNLLRHVLTPTVTHTYNRPSTVPNELLNFAAASAPTNTLTFGLENKLQTRRPDHNRKLRSVDLARLLVSLPYTFRGNGNKQGGRFGNWTFDVECYPWSWLRLESDWTYESILSVPTADTHSRAWNTDLVLVGGKGKLDAQHAHKIIDGQGLLPLGDTADVAPIYKAFQPGPKDFGIALLPQGQWYVGLGHRYSRNDKTESVLEWDWQLTNKWRLGTFYRLTWKEVAPDGSGAKRFGNLREYQLTLTRDLHDWISQFVYRVDREFGEELYFTLTLKAYPEMPLGVQESYHQPKFGSQSSPFSPIKQ